MVFQLRARLHMLNVHFQDFHFLLQDPRTLELILKPGEA